MKKLTIVYERNEETNAIELRTVVIFDDGKEPVVEDFKGIASLYAPANFARENGYDVLEQDGFQRAIKEGLITFVSKANTKDMSELRATIIDQQLRYGALLNENFKNPIIEEASKVENREVEEPKTKTVKKLVKKLDLSDEDRGLHNYLYLSLLRKKNNGLTEEQTADLIGCLRESERARALEDRQIEIDNADENNKAKMQKIYDDLRDAYRAQLADAYKAANVVETEVEVEVPVEGPEEEIKKVKTYNSLNSEKVVLNPERPVILPVSGDEKEEKPVLVERSIEEPVKEIVEEKTPVVEEEKKETKGIVLSENDKDTANYIRLSKLRERRPLTDDELLTLVEIVERNEGARLLENTYTDLIDNGYKKEDEKAYKALFKKYEDSVSGAMRSAREDLEKSNKAEEVNRENVTIERAEADDEDIDIIGDVDDEEKDVVVRELPGEETDESEESSNESSTNEEENGKVIDKEITNADSEESSDDHKDEEEKEEEKGIILVHNEEPVEAREIPHIEDDDPEIIDVDGEEITVKKGSWWKRFLAGASLIVVGALGALGIQELVKKNNTNNNTQTRITVDELSPLDRQVYDDNMAELERLRTEQQEREAKEAQEKAEAEAKAKAEAEAKAKAEAEAKAKAEAEKEAARIKAEAEKEAARIKAEAEAEAKAAQEKAEREQREREAQEKAARDAEAIRVATVEAEKNETRAAVSKFCDEFSVPRETQDFLYRGEVQEFLQQFTNSEQRNEVLTALCYGYEANVLTDQYGNFRLNEDGSNYLTSFTNDFLCAKVVVNQYSPKQMLAVFGDSDISYEQLINGFKNYCYTVTTYGMNAKEPLPFKYLTNNNRNTTATLNDLFDKLIVVNKNREAGTLTSAHTDDFIAEAFNIFVVNDQSLNMSEGAKTVAASIVESFVAIQAQISNGEPLYLHENRGYARAGINLQEVDGEFVIGFPDKTTYEFTSLYDVIDHGYGDKAENADRCLSQQEIILSNLSAMRLLDKESSSRDVHRLRLSNILEECGLHSEAEQLRAGNDTLSFLDSIKLTHPILTESINTYEQHVNGTAEQKNDYKSFETIVNGVDRLLGIQNRKNNNYADLINNRRSAYSMSKQFKIVSGKRYTRDPNATYTTKTEEKKVVKKETTETHEQITIEEMTPEEKKEAEEKVEEMKKDEEEAHEKQDKEVEEAVVDLREIVEEGIEQGKSEEEIQEELDEVAENVEGFELSPTYQEDMAKALEEQKQGEEKQKQIEREIEERNKAAEEEARKRREEEEKAQQEALEEQRRLIEMSQELDEYTPTGDEEEQPGEEDYTHEETDIDQTDTGRTSGDEEDYIPDEEDYVPSAKVKEDLMKLRQELLGSINVYEEEQIESRGMRRA